MHPLLLLVCLQSDVTIGRADPAKDDYLVAARRCREAQTLLESEPRRAVELLDTILADDRIAKRECRLKIEERPGDVLGPYDFLPHQFRGRARLRLASSAEGPELGRLLEGAASDLRASVDRGVASSEAPLAEAIRRLKALRETADLDAFRRTWQRLVETRRFAEARAHIESQALPDAERQTCIAETERACRDYAAAAAETFLLNLEAVKTPQDLADIKPPKFENDFAVPSALPVSTPECEWSRALRGTLVEMRDGKEALDTLLRQAEAALPLAAAERRFAAVERLAYEISRHRIEAQMEEAKDAPPARRLELRSAAESMRTRWDAFQGRVRPALKALPGRDFAALVKRFPVDAEGLDPILARLAGSVHAEHPKRELEDLERELRALWARRETFVAESRRTIATYICVVAALRGVLDGKSPGQVADGLRGIGDELKALGGAVDVAAYGPKIQRILQRLR